MQFYKFIMFILINIYVCVCGSVHDEMKRSILYVEKVVVWLGDILRISSM